MKFKLPKFLSNELSDEACAGAVRLAVRNLGKMPGQATIVDILSAHFEYSAELARRIESNERRIAQLERATPTVKH